MISSTVELEQRVLTEAKMLGRVEGHDKLRKIFPFLFRMKASSLDCGMKVTVTGSKYTDSGPSTTFFSLLEKISRLSLPISFFWLRKGDGGGC